MNYKSFFLSYTLILGVSSAVHDKDMGRFKASSSVSARQSYSNEKQAKLLGIDLNLRIKHQYCNSLFYDANIGTFTDRAVATHFGELAESRFIDLGEVTTGATASKIDTDRFNTEMADIDTTYKAVDSPSVSDANLVIPISSIIESSNIAVNKKLKSLYACAWNQLTSYYTVDTVDKGSPIKGGETLGDLNNFLKRYSALWPVINPDYALSSPYRTDIKQSLGSNIMHHGTRSKNDILYGLRYITCTLFSSINQTRQLVDIFKNIGSDPSLDSSAISAIQLDTTQTYMTIVLNLIAPMIFGKDKSSLLPKNDAIATVDNAFNFLLENGVIDLDRSLNDDLVINPGFVSTTKSELKSYFKEISDAFFDIIYENTDLVFANKDAASDSDLVKTADLITKLVDSLNKKKPIILKASKLEFIKLAFDYQVTADKNLWLLKALKSTAAQPYFIESNFWANISSSASHVGPDTDAASSAKEKYKIIKDSFNVPSTDSDTLAKLDKLIFYKSIKGFFNYINDGKPVSKRRPILKINKDLTKTEVPFSKSIEFFIDANNSEMLKQYLDLVYPTIKDADKQLLIADFKQQVFWNNKYKFVNKAHDDVSAKDEDKFSAAMNSAIEAEISSIESNLVVDIAFSKALGMSIEELGGISVSGESFMFTTGKSICISTSKIYDPKKNIGSHLDIGFGGIILTETYSPRTVDNNSIGSLFKLSTRDMGLGVVCGLDLFSYNNSISVSPEIGVMFSISAMSKVKGSEFSPGSSAVIKDPTDAYKSIERQVFKPIIKMSIPIRVKVADQLFINLEFNKLIVTRMLKQEHKSQKLKSFLIENRKCDSIGFGVTFIS